MSYQWNNRYCSGPGTGPGFDATVPGAAEVLTENQHLLPSTGIALDLACGLGGNAWLLARAGLATHAWDYSPVAIERVAALADAQGVVIDAAVRDVVVEPPESDRFDIIVVSRFLHRQLMPHLIASLRTGGLLFYQTFCVLRVQEGGPGNPAFLLHDNELLILCQTLKIRAYRENALVGDQSLGLRNMAWLVGEKS